MLNIRFIIIIVCIKSDPAKRIFMSGDVSFEGPAIVAKTA